MSFTDKLWAESELKAMHDAVNQWIKTDLQQTSEISISWICRELANQISLYERGLSLLNRPREQHIEYVKQRTIDTLKHDIFIYFKSAQRYHEQTTVGVDSTFPNPMPTRSLERRAMNDGLPALIASRPEIFCDEPPRGPVLRIAFGSDSIVDADPNAAALPFRMHQN